MIQFVRERKEAFRLFLNQLQIINPLTSRLDVQLTNMANRLMIETDNYSLKIEPVLNWRVDYLNWDGILILPIVEEGFTFIAI